MKECREMLSSGPNITVTHKNSQQQLQLTADLHKIKPVGNSSMEEGGATQASPLEEELLAVDGRGESGGVVEKESLFLRR